MNTSIKSPDEHSKHLAANRKNIKARNDAIISRLREAIDRTWQILAESREAVRRARLLTHRQNRDGDSSKPRV